MTARSEEIVSCARRLIEQGWGGRLTMRRIAAELGIRAPSLYKHFPDKESITRAVYVDYLAGQRDALIAAIEVHADGHPLVRVSRAYRTYALANAELARYCFLLPYPRDEAEDVLRGLRRQWVRAAGDSDLAMASYAFTRGMTDLELHMLYPPHAEPPRAYEEGLAALVARSEALAAERRRQPL